VHYKVKPIDIDNKRSASDEISDWIELQWI